MTRLEPANGSNPLIASQSYKYLGNGKVKVLLASETGEVMSYIISTAMLVKSVDLAIELINNHARRVFTDLNMF